MNTIPMTAEHRTAVRRGLGALRRSGKLPAVLYGADKTPVTLQLNSREASRTLNRIVGTALIDLDVHGENHKALVREIQRNFVTDEILHVDFYEVAMDRVMRVYIPLRQVGVAPAVTLLGGILVRGLADIEIECLPGDLVSGIEVDLTVLKAIGDSVHVSDLQVPSTIKVLTHGDEQVSRVTYASTEELTAEKPEVAAEVEVVEKGKKEEEGEEE
ncbi:MAG: 50S ribosomal protein L25 [Chloroflexi bacterium]|nr:50S ribosomal protein L25 [Chloroflexota bacterium]